MALSLASDVVMEPSRIGGAEEVPVVVPARSLWSRRVSLTFRVARAPVSRRARGDAC